MCLNYMLEIDTCLNGYIFFIAGSFCFASFLVTTTLKSHVSILRQFFEKITKKQHKIKGENNENAKYK